MFPPNFYLKWRAARHDGALLLEKNDQAPPEALLQQVWLYQRLIEDRLHTTDGEPVRILHPGFLNREPGPDFRKAVVQVGANTPVSGDIEIDLVPSGWHQHAHAGNPAYRDVVLHVTWEPGSRENHLPNLPLKHALDSSIPDLTFWLGVEPKPMAPGLEGRCAGPFRDLEPHLLRHVLRQAAQARLQTKAEAIQARSRQVGWDLALYEGLFAALGYKRNTWPMRRVAQLVPRLSAGAGDGNPSLLLLQARFFGVAGLLPRQLGRSESSAEYLRAVWDLWWREADSYNDVLLPGSIWTLGGIRPANHPERRLALAAHWLAKKDLPGQLEDWIERTIESPDLVESLEQILAVPEDSFWSRRWTLRGKELSGPQEMLGRQRLTDLAMNVVMPWLYVRALAGKNQKLAAAAEQRFFLWPAGEDNAVLKLARTRLFGGVSAKFLKTAADQQALHQIVRDFCEYSNSACENCRFPALLQAAVRSER